MNELYHDVTIGFNPWFVVGPTMMFVMWFLGVMSNKIDMIDLEIMEQDNQKSHKIFAAFLAVLFHGEVMIESGRGIFQTMLNHTDNPAYLAFVIPVLLMISLPTCWYVLYMSAMFGKWLSLGYLVYARTMILAEREAEEEKQQPVMITLEKPDNIVNFNDIRPEIDLIK